MGETGAFKSIWRQDWTVLLEHISNLSPCPGSLVPILTAAGVGDDTLQMLAQQYAAANHHHLAALLHLAIHQPHAAIHMYREAGLLLEAAAVASARLLPQEPLQLELRGALADHLSSKGLHVAAAANHVLSQQPPAAVAALLRAGGFSAAAAAVELCCRALLSHEASLQMYHQQLLRQLLEALAAACATARRPQQLQPLQQVLRTCQGSALVCSTMAAVSAALQVCCCCWQLLEVQLAEHQGCQQPEQQPERQPQQEQRLEPQQQQPAQQGEEQQPQPKHQLEQQQQRQLEQQQQPAQQGEQPQQQQPAQPALQLSGSTSPTLDAACGRDSQGTLPAQQPLIAAMLSSVLGAPGSRAVLHCVSKAAAGLAGTAGSAPPGDASAVLAALSIAAHPAADGANSQQQQPANVLRHPGLPCNGQPLAQAVTAGTGCLVAACHCLLAYLRHAEPPAVPAGQQARDAAPPSSSQQSGCGTSDPSAQDRALGQWTLASEALSAAASAVAANKSTTPSPTGTPGGHKQHVTEPAAAARPRNHIHGQPVPWTEQQAQLQAEQQRQQRRKQISRFKQRLGVARLCYSKGELLQLRTSADSLPSMRLPPGCRLDWFEPGT